MKVSGLAPLLLMALFVSPKSVVAQAAAEPTVEVMAMAVIKADAPMPEVRKHVQEEVTGVIRMYLDGKIDQWYSRADGRGVFLFFRSKSVDEVKALLAPLPLVKAGYVDIEYIPLCPYRGLAALAAAASEAAKPVAQH
jgi:hypothetical protein